MLVQRAKAEAKTTGGLFLPESSVKELNEAKVLAVGPGGMDKDGKTISMSVKPGDRVLIPQVCWPMHHAYFLLMFQYGGSPIKVGEEEFSLFRDHEYVQRARLPFTSTNHVTAY